jgi:hypothetical protein
VNLRSAVPPFFSAPRPAIVFSLFSLGTRCSFSARDETATHTTQNTNVTDQARNDRSYRRRRPVVDSAARKADVASTTGVQGRLLSNIICNSVLSLSLLLFLPPPPDRCAPCNFRFLCSRPSPTGEAHWSSCFLVGVCMFPMSVQRSFTRSPPIHV